MLISHYFFLLINLSMLKCASTDDPKIAEAIQTRNSEDSSKRDIFSRYLNEELLHRVLQYDAKSTGRMAKANRSLRILAKSSRTFRYFEGAGWDMPELANICEFSIKDKNRPELEAEMAIIMALSRIKKESVFDERLTILLFNNEEFKELVGPVLKYIIRRYYEKLAKGKVKVNINWRNHFILAVKNRLYDVFFELGKDPGAWNCDNLETLDCGIHGCFYFDCYNNYVYKNRTRTAFMWEKMTAANPNDYTSSKESMNPGGEKLSHLELYAWIAVAIYRRVPEDKYVPYLSNVPHIFLDIIQSFVCKYSPITFDEVEKNYFHEFIVCLLDKNFGNIPQLENDVKFTKLLNDVRFGYFYESFYKDRIANLDELDGIQIALLIMAASKANNKLLVKQLAKHPEFKMEFLECMVELRSPKSFKVYFDMIEDEPLRNVKYDINYYRLGLVRALSWNKFKFTKAIKTYLGNKFEIHSPIEYVELGFASKYEILLDSEEFISNQFHFVKRILNNIAKDGVDEFIQFITDHCGEDNTGPAFLGFNSFGVSFEVIQILLEHQELIVMLANRSVVLHCCDKRLKHEEIPNFRKVINPN